jgi:hypothetical protein
MTYLLVNWHGPKGMDAAIISDECGMPRIFLTKEEAEEYVNTNLNGSYAIVEVEG